MAVLRLWVLASAQLKHVMVTLSSLLELLEIWEHVPPWEPLSPLEIPHGDVGGNAPRWIGDWKVGEDRVVVVGRDGIGLLRDGKICPVVEAP